MKTMINRGGLILFMVFITLAGYCQMPADSGTLFRVETRDGNEYTGTLITQDSAGLILQTEKLGVLTFNHSDIRRFYPINPDKVKGDQYWFDNPQSSRYFWEPNGYGLKKGEGYYQNIWVLFNQVSIGVTDNFSIGAGMVPLFLFGGLSTPAWITPKFSVPVKKDKFNLGAGALVATVLGEGETAFGLLYGIATAGSRDKNISLGLGYGYSGKNWSNSPTVSLSSMIRTGAKGYFLTENYYISAGDGYLLIFSAGYRWIIKKAGMDFGLFMPYENTFDSLLLIPWLGITIPFGNTR
jgi:hypothetical protein